MSSPKPPEGLPAPDADALAHSARLTRLIAGEAKAAGGSLDFARFMELALYAPGLGYYSAGSRKFGPEGDFVTAPEISPLFAACLARQCAEILALTGGELLEFGAGSGAMATDLLLELERMRALPERYLIMEVSADLRERQRDTLTSRAPHLLERVAWLDALPQRFRGVVVGNEVLDAMPVQRFRIRSGAVRELRVAWNGEGFEWQEAEPGPRLREAVECLRAEFPLDEGYESELGLAAQEWVAAAGGWLEQGALLLVDYGFPRREFYHPQRHMGTLMCHYRHRAHADPLILLGLQDITAHVDFTAMAEAAHGAGLRVAGFANQGNFLIALGLAEFMAEPLEPRARLERTAQVKKLTLPHEMGELFKVIALTRGVDIPLRGFLLRDDRARL